LAAETSYGRVRIPARNLAGIVPTDADVTKAWLLLADGQAVLGELPDEPLTLRLADGSSVEVPLGKVRECGLRSGGDGQRPAAPAAEGPKNTMTLLLGTGERLTCSGPVGGMTVETAHGRAAIPAGRITRLERLGDKAGTCKLTLRSGSRLYGVPGDKALTVQLALGPRATVEIRQIAALGAPAPAAAGQPGERAVVITGNGDRLIGELARKPLTVRTCYGEIQVWPSSAAKMTFGGKADAEVTIRMWDATTIVGTVVEKELSFSAKADGLAFRLPTGQVETISRANPMPPPMVAKRVGTLIGQLGSESFKVRAAATAALVKLGPGIGPLLKKHANARGLEIRLRIAEVLDKLGARR
jgi:hypothetical protein